MSPRTVAWAADEFLAARLGQVAASTWATDYSKLAQLPLEVLGLPVEDLDSQILWQALATSPGALATRKRTRITLKAFTRWLYERGLTPANVGAALPMPKTGNPPRPPRPIPWEDVPRVVSRVRPHYRPLVLFAAHTGLRMGELAALTQADLQPHHPTRPFVSVTKSQTKGFPVTTPKSGRSRVVPLDRVAREVALNILAAPPHKTLAFPGPRGGLLATPNFLRDSGWATAAPGHRFHDLRHTAAARWLEIPEIAEVDIQRWLGHADLSQTQHYLSGIGASRRDQALLAALNRGA